MILNASSLEYLPLGSSLPIIGELDAAHKSCAIISAPNSDASLDLTAHLGALTKISTYVDLAIRSFDDKKLKQLFLMQMFYKHK